MREDEGFDILHNGVPRTFRDRKATAHEAARFAKARFRADIIEILDRSNAIRWSFWRTGGLASCRRIGFERRRFR